ncbi:MAG: hypothetical protein JXA82_03455 [Sedimentisphaerales bacterium]|nr:hypothetical protein [Sedimentisphaerales bacterium]
MANYIAKYWFLWLITVFCTTGGPIAAPSLDTSKYITIDEIRPGNEGYCLTVYQDTRIEKFPLKVLSVVRNWQPGRDAILVVGTDERFIHTGTVAGCSGSPVYLDGRMAGALAAGWFGSKDPLYIVTPIEYMLNIGTGSDNDKGQLAFFSIDSDGPIDLAVTHKQYLEQLAHLTGHQNVAPNAQSLIPLVTSLPSRTCDFLSEHFAAMGFTPIAAGQSLPEGPAPATLEPGGVLAVPLMSGDISMAATGTVTEVIGNKVFGFGHAFGGIGPVDLPLSAGTVHTVVPGVLRAFKFSSPGPIVGALRYDEACGIVGFFGEKAKLIPVTIHVNRYNDPQRRTYRCQMANDRLRGPALLQSAIVGAIEMYGDMPPEHTIRYSGAVDVQGFETIHINNISSGSNYLDAVSDVAGAVEQAMLNPFARTQVQSISMEIDFQNKNIRAGIKQAELSDLSVKPGQLIQLDVVLQSYLSEKTYQTVNVTIPDDIPSGSYDLFILGSDEYTKFISRTAPYKLTGYDMPTLIKALRTLLAIRRDHLYVVLSLPDGGLTIQQDELPHLPATKTMLMQDDKRLTTSTRPMKHWITQSHCVGKVVSGSQTVKITVEKP